MAIEAVNQIKAAEDESAALIQRVRLQAKEAVRRAEDDGQNLARRKADEAAAARQTLLAQAEADAALIIGPLIVRGDEDVALISRPDNQRFDETVHAVIHILTEGIL